MNARVILKVALISFFTIAAIPNTPKPGGLFPQCSTPSIILKFKDMPRCPNGNACVSHSDCSSGSCVPSPVNPTSITVDVYSGSSKVVDGLQVSSSSGTAAFVLPKASTKISSPSVSQSKNKMVVKWTTVCANNQQPCSSDSDCAGGVCIRSSEEVEIGVRRISGESC